MSWTMPNEEQLRNIIYNATSGFREHGSLRGALIHQARVAQGIAIVNRVRQEVDDPPGWGRRALGTESATVGAAADAGILSECAAAARAALAQGAALPATDLTVPANLRGAQFYKHSFRPPGLRWRGDPETHLVAAFGPMLEEAALQRCRLLPDPEAIPVCRGYLGVYVNFLYIGRARAGLTLHRDPHQVPIGPERRRANAEARDLPWGEWLQRHGP
jgi:hypothetical protein